MKQYVFLFFCLSLFCFSSCEKPDFPDSVEKADLVVSICQIEQTPFTRADAEQFFTRLCFAVYDSLGTRVKQINQEADDKDFGTAGFQLPEGKYRVVVVAHSSNGNPTLADPAKILFKNNQGFTDTFLHNDSIVVTDKRATLSVNLERITSLCRFVVVDSIPNNVSKLHFLYTGGSGAFNAATGLGCVNSKQTMTFPVEAGKDSTYYDLYTFLHADEGDLHIQVTAHDANDNVLNEREFNIPMRRRMVTKVTGSYFTGSDTTSGLTISIGVNTAWEGEQVISY